DKVARLHFNCLAYKPQPGRTLEYQHPFVLLLVVPEIWWRCMAVRNDALDAEVSCAEQRNKKLVRQMGGQIREEVSSGAHEFLHRGLPTTADSRGDEFVEQSPILHHERLALVAEPAGIAVTEQQSKLTELLRICRQIVPGSSIHTPQTRFDPPQKAERIAGPVRNLGRQEPL